MAKRTSIQILGDVLSELRMAERRCKEEGQSQEAYDEIGTARFHVRAALKESKERPRKK